MTALKNIAENLAVRKNCVTLYCDRAISHIADIYKLRHSRRVPAIHLLRAVVALSQEKGARLPFCNILTNLFLAKCDRAKQVVRPRSAVRVPRRAGSIPVPSRPIGPIIHPTKSNTLPSCERRHPRMLSGGSSRCSRLCIPPTPPSWATSSVLKPIELWHI